MSRLRIALALSTAFAFTGVATAQQTLIGGGSAWRFRDTGANLGSAWILPSYSDASWPTGFAQLGYGDGDEVTVVSYGGNSTNRFITTYFRHGFSVADPSAVSALTLRYVRDDGAVIYLNGVEVARSNLPAGTITYTTRASVAIGGADESAWLTVPVSQSLLVAGTNVVAVEIHQQSPQSTDISFDLELTATAAVSSAPSVTLVSPANGSVVNSPAVTFTASASASAGLTSATLFVGDAPRTVQFTGPTRVQDAQLTADTPTVAAGAGLAINVDGQTPHAHGLLKFPTLIGTNTDQVPAGATISSAVLELSCTNAGQAMQIYRLTQDWVENEATWLERAAGVAWGAAGADGAASNAGVATVGDCTATGRRSIDLSAFVQEWSNGAPNYGVVFVDSGTDGVDFDSSEATSSPTLTVVYRGNQTAVATQPLSGTSAQVSFNAVLALGRTYSWDVRATDTAGRIGSAAPGFSLVLDSAVPDEPVLLEPSSGSANVSTLPILAAGVSDPAGGTLNASVSLRRAAGSEFTIVVLPDTQHYSEAFPEVFSSQTQWIVDNVGSRNIVFVTHEGDIVEHASNTLEWQRADASMSMLDGVVPYGMGPGNHDQPTTLYNQYFPYTRYQGYVWYGGHYQNLNDNNYQLFSAGGMDFVIVHLEFCPPTAAVTWASTVLQTYPQRIGIMTTHGYLNEAAQRTVHGCSDTAYLWDDLAVPNPNLRFMLSGHVHNESRRIDTVGTRTVFQMLADYQDRASGGEGWLRILRFVPGENRIYVQTYSPWLGRYEVDANSEFQLDFPMGGAFAVAGATTVDSGAVASVTPARLAAFTEYEWQMTVTNGSGRSRTSPIWRFTTGADGSVNRAPVAESQLVTTPEDTQAVVTLRATDADFDPLTYTVVTSPLRGTLSGSAPDLRYTPVADYNGSDSFTFRAGDGSLDSAPATVSINVQAVNDAPAAAGDSFTAAGNQTLTVGAPGVLGNDTDVDSTLTARLVTSPSRGSLALGADGTFSYTPDVGFSGTDAFVYEATDGSAAASAATVTITVTPVAPPPPSPPVLSADFSTSTNGFGYVDNLFRGASQSAYASGSRVTTGGGALRVLLGGIDNAAIFGISGGWRRTFTLSEPTVLVLSLRYSLDQGPDYESDELSEVLASIDGTLLGAGTDYVARIAGNGNGGATISTGWQLFQIPLGTLGAGTHTLVIGGFNSKKTTSTERTTILLDDVTIAAP
jgi:hypothetical protein